ncbi:MAG: hypothetical protein KAI79_19950 [Bacteroidales bacterium]|nr:hypothetical protein [Bacteroidales bacterium]
MKKIFIFLGLTIIVLLNSCATSSAIKDDSKEIWHETKEVSKEAWHGTRQVSKKAWSDSKKAVHNATEE